MQAGFADGFQQTDGAGAGDVGGVFGTIEAHANMALGGEIVNFLRLNLAEQPRQGAGIGQVAIMEEQPVFSQVRVGVNAVQPAGVEGAGAADQAVNLVAFGEQQLREVGTVLPGDAGDEGFFHFIKLEIEKTESRNKKEQVENRRLEI